MSRTVLERAYDRIEQLEAELAQVQRVTGERESQHRREVTKLKADLDAALADKQTYEGRWAKASGVIQQIVNDPLMPRDQVQSRLLVFTQSR